MSRQPSRGRAYALVELLLAAVVLAICIVPITGSISYMRTNAMQARIESQVQGLMQWYLDLALDGAKTTALVAGSSSATWTLAGGVVVSYTKTVAAVPGYTKLFAITYAATWTAPSNDSRTDTTTLTLYALSV